MTNVSFTLTERYMIGAFICILLLCITAFVSQGVSVDVRACALILSCSALLLSVGAFYRITGRSAAIGSTAIGIAILLLLTGSISTLNYLAICLHDRSYDALLVRMDASIGFSWPRAMEMASRNPTLSWVLGLIYQSTSLQLVLLILVIGLSGRQKALDRMLLTYTFSAMSVVAIWSIFPSLGPMAYFQVPTEIIERVRPVVGPSYGLEMRKLLENGVHTINPIETLGLVAFPSFHTVLALMTIVTASSVRWLFPIALILNILMLPAVVIHGGHHLVDLLAGSVLFLVALTSADWLLARQVQVPMVRPVFLSPQSLL